MRSVRWKRATWDQLYDVESQHEGRVKVNRIAEVAVGWGPAFLRTLTPQLTARILGARGEKRLTFQETQRLREELQRKLGTLAGAFRLTDRLALALPAPAKQLIRDEASREHVSMSAVARRHLMLQEAN